MPPFVEPVIEWREPRRAGKVEPLLEPCLTMGSAFGTRLYPGYISAYEVLPLLYDFLLPVTVDIYIITDSNTIDLIINLVI